MTEQKAACNLRLLKCVVLLRFTWQCVLRSRSSVLWHHVSRWIDNILQEAAASIFIEEGSLRWRQQIPPKCWYLPNHMAPT